MKQRETETADRLSALRESTRAALCERLMRARCYMDKNYHHKLPLADVAQIAFLSPHHFLRSFKQAFGLTPHQYLVNLRLDAARNALTGGDNTVSQICYEVGFESIGSFSWLFKKHFGLSPDQYRKKLLQSSVS